MSITKGQLEEYITAQEALITAVREDARLTAELKSIDTLINNGRRRRDFVHSDYNTQIDQWQREREELERRYAESQRALMQCESAMKAIYKKLAENG